MMQVVQAGNGWLWLKQGAALYRRDATGWLMLVLAFLMVSAAFNLTYVNSVDDARFVDAAAASTSAMSGSATCRTRRARTRTTSSSARPTRPSG